MSDLIARAEGWFTPARRKTIYRIMSGVLLLLMVNGVLDAESAQGYALALSHILAVGATELAAANVTYDDE